jgi:hypothetical protein
LLEISRIRRRLIFLGGHQQVLSAQIIILLANLNVTLPSGTNVFGPPRPVICRATIALGYSPRPRQGMVDYHGIDDQAISSFDQDPKPCNSCATNLRDKTLAQLGLLSAALLPDAAR